MPNYHATSPITKMVESSVDALLFLLSLSGRSQITTHQSAYLKWYYTQTLGVVVSLTFRKLSKIISRKYTTPEITFMMSISSWNFGRVHTYKVSAWNCHKKISIIHRFQGNKLESTRKVGEIPPSSHSLNQVDEDCKYKQEQLQWRHDERVGVSNQQPHDCLHNRVFRRRSKKIPKLHVTGFCQRNSPVTGEFPAQRASNSERVSIWWRRHDMIEPSTHPWPLSSVNAPISWTTWTLYFHIEQFFYIPWTNAILQQPSSLMNQLRISVDFLC